MLNYLKKYLKNILLIALSLALIAIYFQAEKIKDLERINAELNRRKDYAFMYSLSISSKSGKLADSLENLSYIKADAHYNEYKDLFKQAVKDSEEWRSEINQLIRLGGDDDLINDIHKYYSNSIYRVIAMYRFNNISPVDFSNEWRLTLQNTAKLLRTLDEKIDSIKSPHWFYIERVDGIKRMLLTVLEENSDQINSINNAEYDRMRKQIEDIVKDR